MAKSRKGGTLAAPTPEGQLSKAEKDQLEKLEWQATNALEKVASGFEEFGAAMGQIRDQRLYRGSATTWDEYCQRFVGRSKRYVDRIIAAQQLLQNLGPSGPILPVTEYQARPLTALPPEEQGPAWEEAVERANGDHPSAATVAQVVAERKATASEPVPLQVGDWVNAREKESGSWETGQITELGRKWLILSLPSKGFPEGIKIYAHLEGAIRVPPPTVASEPASKPVSKPPQEKQGVKFPGGKPPWDIGDYVLAPTIGPGYYEVLEMNGAFSRLENAEGCKFWLENRFIQPEDEEGEYNPEELAEACLKAAIFPLIESPDPLPESDLDLYALLDQIWGEGINGRCSLSPDIEWQAWAGDYPRLEIPSLCVNLQQDFMLDAIRELFSENWPEKTSAGAGGEAALEGGDDDLRSGPPLLERAVSDWPIGKKVEVCDSADRHFGQVGEVTGHRSPSPSDPDKWAKDPFRSTAPIVVKFADGETDVYHPWGLLPAIDPERLLTIEGSDLSFEMPNSEALAKFVATHPTGPLEVVGQIKAVILEYRLNDGQGVKAVQLPISHVELL